MELQIYRAQQLSETMPFYIMSIVSVGRLVNRVPHFIWAIYKYFICIILALRAL